MRIAPLFVGIFVLAVCIVVTNGQNINDLELTPKETVERLWAMAAAGDLLTSAGSTGTSRLFTQSSSTQRSKSVLVVSNHFGVVNVSVQGDAATVTVDCNKLGRIDSELRFTPEPAPKTYREGIGYRLVVRHRHVITYTQDGKTILQDKEIPESRVWQIEGPPDQPWTTVNTAIRFILEQKAKATDSTVIRNADQTLSKLLALH